MAKSTPSWLTKRVQYMIEQAIEKKTNEGYKSAFRQYIRFCHMFNLTPLPITEMKMMYWMAHCTSEVKASSALTNYYGVKKMATFFGQPFDDTN